MIAVLGSINMDLVVRVPTFPRPGETMHGTSAAYHEGGKGANQAVAAARLGADVHFFGKVGDDATGQVLVDGLERNGVCVDAVERERGSASGLASIWVDDRGDNAIALSAGANGRVDEPYLDRHLDEICRAEFLLLQLEIPSSLVQQVLQRLPKSGLTVLLDPSPAQDLSGWPLERIDILTPNEGELASITGTNDIDRAACQLLSRGVKHVICTLGERGAVWYSGERHIVRVPSPRVNVVDTTAAGDAFNGALAWALQSTDSLRESLKWAVTAGAVATTTAGAQPSLPDASTLDRWMRSNGDASEHEKE
jgi:ribokinase